MLKYVHFLSHVYSEYIPRGDYAFRSVVHMMTFNFFVILLVSFCLISNNLNKSHRTPATGQRSVQFCGEALTDPRLVCISFGLLEMSF